MKPEPPNQPEPSAPVRRFTLMTWLSIYGRDCYQDFVKESDYAKLEAALTAAQSELAELRRDKERLDWLEKNSVGFDYNPGFPDIGHDSNYGPEPGQPPFWGAHIDQKGLAMADTLRATIDAARKAITATLPEPTGEKGT